MQDDAMHKYTTHLVREYDAICIEDLDVKGMLILAMSLQKACTVHCLDAFAAILNTSASQPGLSW